MMSFIQSIIDFILHIDAHLAFLVAQYGTWIYAILFIIVFCETGLVVTPFLPGDSLLFAAGALAALTTNELSVALLILLMVCAAVLGDAVNYDVGRLLGKRLFSNAQSRIFKQKYLQQTQAFYRRYGGKTIILARFLPIIRTYAPFVAGISNMPYRHFAFFNLIGALLWVLIFTLLGYVVGNITFIKNHLTLLAFVIIVISLLPMLLHIWRGIGQARKQKQLES